MINIYIESIVYEIHAITLCHQRTYLLVLLWDDLSSCCYKPQVDMHTAQPLDAGYLWLAKSASQIIIADTQV